MCEKTILHEASEPEFSQSLNKLIQTKGDLVAMLLVYSGIQLRLHLLLGYSICLLQWEDACWVICPSGAMRAPQGGNRAVSQSDCKVFIYGGLDSV